MPLQSKLFRHYKNKNYKLIGFVRHSESLEEMALYEALYPNEKGHLWVRPKGMFFEEIEVESKKVPRFKQAQIRYENYSDLSPQHQKLIVELASKALISNLDPEKIERKILGKNILLSLAFEGDLLIGFKLGFEVSSNTFYSWLGAVHPNYQKLGLGQNLMRLQHKKCRELGYEYVETKTMNRWKHMLLLNIKEGFEVYGVEEVGGHSSDIKILMRKDLRL